MMAHSSSTSVNQPFVTIIRTPEARGKTNRRRSLPAESQCVGDEVTISEGLPKSLKSQAEFYIGQETAQIVQRTWSETMKGSRERLGRTSGERVVVSHIEAGYHTPVEQPKVFPGPYQAR